MDESDITLIFDNLKEDLEKSVTYLKNEFAVVRAGRANPHILDRIVIDYYGAPTPLNQMANFNVQDARMLVVNLYDISQLNNVRRALSEANLGVNISDDGKMIRLSFPALTEERRREIAKSLRTTLENAKVAMRNSRRDAIDMLKNLKKDSKISEDEEANKEKEVQKLLDSYISTLDSLYAIKEKEIMEV